MDVRPIDAIALHKEIMECCKYDFSRKLNLAQILLFIEKAQTVDVKPMRHGRWINDTFCSECKRFPVPADVSISEQVLTKIFSWCPHCGAKLNAENTDILTNDGGTDNVSSV